MSDDHTCFSNLQSTVPVPTTPPLTTSVFTASTPSVSSLINSENPNMIKAQVFVGNLKEVCVSRETQTSNEMLCNENSPILYDSTDAHEMSKDYYIGEIVDEEMQPFIYDKKPISPTTTTSTTIGGFNGLNKNSGPITFTAGNGNIQQSNNQTNFNQNTTNFIVCSLDSFKPLNV